MHAGETGDDVLEIAREVQLLPTRAWASVHAWGTATHSQQWSLATVKRVIAKCAGSGCKTQPSACGLQGGPWKDLPPGRPQVRRPFREVQLQEPAAASTPQPQVEKGGRTERCGGEGGEHNHQDDERPQAGAPLALGRRGARLAGVVGGSLLKASGRRV